MPMSGWTDFLRNTRNVTIGIFFTLSWYLGLALSSGFRNWNKVALMAHCNKGDWNILRILMNTEEELLKHLCVRDRHFPHQYSHAGRGITLVMLKDDVVNLSMKICLTLSVLLSICSTLQWFMRSAPVLSGAVLRSGTRTLYGYILHWVVIYTISDAMDFPLLINYIPEAYLPIFFCTFAIFLVMILTSALTERLLSWLIMPMWLMNLCPCCLSTPKEPSTESKPLPKDKEPSTAESNSLPTARHTNGQRTEFRAWVPGAPKS